MCSAQAYVRLSIVGYRDLQEISAGFPINVIQAVNRPDLQIKNTIWVCGGIMKFAENLWAIGCSFMNNQFQNYILIRQNLPRSIPRYPLKTKLLRRLRI